MESRQRLFLSWGGMPEMNSPSLQLTFLFMVKPIGGKD
jgi:hypothetical protein